MPSELAEAVAGFSSALPARTRATLAHLLTRNLAEANVLAEGTESRLGLLLELLLSSEGEFPTVRSYEGARETAQEGWPSASRLVRTYGSWVASVKAALSLGSVGSTRSKMSSYPSQPYSRDEALYSLVQFEHALGHWPTSFSEYGAWSSASRAIQLKWGTTHRRIASITVLKRKFGTLEAAVSAAERRYLP